MFTKPQKKLLMLTAQVKEQQSARPMNTLEDGISDFTSRVISVNANAHKTPVYSGKKSKNIQLGLQKGIDLLT